MNNKDLERLANFAFENNISGSDIEENLRDIQKEIWFRKQSYFEQQKFISKNRLFDKVPEDIIFLIDVKCGDFIKVEGVKTQIKAITSSHYTHGNNELIVLTCYNGVIDHVLYDPHLKNIVNFNKTVCFEELEILSND